ncbi:MAG: ribonuclease HI family protein [Candidatus Pacebacteria bacterium]|nr:ribonuclease HI family protein [Candidatus Paceibacterota bacterium]MDD5013140.1 ribonuclease HI family protein [Candidatus Paceibacterota bacterium]MDD5752903.1 ribonuclease HI family protein [Candidatus Paceibacterota bacterium]
MKIIINTDGASRGNPGKGAVGVVISNEKGEIVKKHGEYLGDKITNNEAEYEAVVIALKKVKALIGKDKTRGAEIEIRSDSELMVNQMSGKYKITEKHLQEKFINIWNLKTEFGKVIFIHVPREKNKEADALANYALDENSKKSLF